MVGGTSGGVGVGPGRELLLDDVVGVVRPEVVPRGDEADVRVGGVPDVDHGLVPCGHLDQHVFDLGFIQLRGLFDALHDVFVHQADLVRGHIVAGVAFEGLAEILIDLGLDLVELEVPGQGVDIEKGQVDDLVFVHGVLLKEQ